MFMLVLGWGLRFLNGVDMVLFLFLFFSGRGGAVVFFSLVHFLFFVLF